MTATFLTDINALIRSQWIQSKLICTIRLCKNWFDMQMHAVDRLQSGEPEPKMKEAIISAVLHHHILYMPSLLECKLLHKRNVLSFAVMRQDLW